MDKQQILDAYAFRHACKEFNPEQKITEDNFQFIMETARLSPSSFGFEPWRFLIVQNPAVREKLATVTWGGGKQLATASHFVITLARKKQDMAAHSDYVQHIMKETHQLPDNVIAQRTAAYDRFLKTDFALFDNERAMFEWACRQTYIAAGNMMTAAALIGIDSCPIEGFNKEQAEDLLAREGLLDTQSFGVSCMLAFGYRLEQPREKTRQSAQEIIQYV